MFVKKILQNIFKKNIFHEQNIKIKILDSRNYKVNFQIIFLRQNLSFYVLYIFYDACFDIYFIYSVYYVLKKNFFHITHDI